MSSPWSRERSPIQWALTAVVGGLLLLHALPTGAVTRIVPTEIETIQAALGASSSGDTVLVLPGHYFVQLDFQGKDVKLRSLSGPADTILDGGGRGSVISLVSGEGAGALIEGFTITGGAGNAVEHTAGGISCKNGSSPVIRGNRFVDNETTCGGGGILASDGSEVLIEGNEFLENRCGSRGGGIFLMDTHATVRGNVLRDNQGAAYGGAVHVWLGDPVIESNLIVGNRAVRGGGAAADGGAPRFLFNTVADCSCDLGGSGIHATGGAEVEIRGNILVRNRGGPAVVSEGAGSAELTCNDIWDHEAGAYGGTVAPGSGDFSADPRFTEGPDGGYYLSSRDAGQEQNSPGLEAGGVLAGAAGLDRWSVRSDRRGDTGLADLGFHRRAAWRVPEELATIAQALALSSPGDRIEVEPGVYREELDLGEGDRLLIGLDGPGKTFLVGSGAGPVICLQGGQTHRTVIQGWTITGGSADRGGGIWCDQASPILRALRLQGNRSRIEGGGAGFRASRAILQACLLEANESDLDGGGLSAREAELTVRGCTFWRNRARRYGSSIASSGTRLELANSIVGAGTGAPGIHLSGGDGAGDLTNNDVWGHPEGDYGGQAVPGVGDFSTDPLMVSGPGGGTYLSQVTAGQTQDSPCLDRCSMGPRDWLPSGASTRTDWQVDQGAVDLGFHWPVPTGSGSWLRVLGNQESYGPEEELTLHLALYQEEELLADLVLVLETEGAFLFWPDWAPELTAHRIDCPADLLLAARLLRFDWPGDLSEGEACFHAALLEPGEMSPAGLLELDRFCFRFGPPIGS